MISVLSLVEITAFRLESKSGKGFFFSFPPMGALEIITGHVIYNLSYTYKFQLKTTLEVFACLMQYIYRQSSAYRVL